MKVKTLQKIVNEHWKEHPECEGETIDMEWSEDMGSYIRYLYFCMGCVSPLPEVITMKKIRKGPEE